MKHCTHRWRAGRTEVPEAIVEHVCVVNADHNGPHVCSCGAYVENEERP